MTRYRYRLGPSLRGPDQIDVATIPMPAAWQANAPETAGASGRPALTETAIDQLLDALGGEQFVEMPEDLSPYAVAALLDAAWDREQPWRGLIQWRLRQQGWPLGDVQMYLNWLQGQWNRAWVDRHGDYTAWLTEWGTYLAHMDDGERRRFWIDEEVDRRLRIEANPGRLSAEQIAQVTRAAIERVARDPGDRLVDDLIRDVLPRVEAEVAAVPPPLEAAGREPEAVPASVVTDMVSEYLLARTDWGWPAGRAGAWAVGQVVDRHNTLAAAQVAREENDSVFAAQAEWDLEVRTKDARAAWAAHDSDPWLPSDVEALLATAPSPDRIWPGVTEQARAAATNELLDWVDAARRPPERPVQLQYGVARRAAEEITRHRDEELLALQGLRGQLQKAQPWWWPGTWRRRAELGSQIEQRLQVVVELNQRVRDADAQASASLPRFQADDHASARRAVGAHGCDRRPGDPGDPGVELLGDLVKRGNLHASDPTGDLPTPPPERPPLVPVHTGDQQPSRAAARHNTFRHVLLLGQVDVELAVVLGELIP